MKYYTLAPPASLAGFVRFFWVLEHEVAGEPYIHRTMADGCAELIFHYKGRFDEINKADHPEKSFVAGLHGPSQTFRRFVIDQDFGIFGVYFYPFAIPALFGIPSCEISNEMPDLGSLLGSGGRELEERVIAAGCNQERFQIICAYLESRLARQRLNEPAVFSIISQIIHTKGLARIPDLAASSFLSTRQFERKFKAYSGFSPKLFSRIIRFQDALNAYGTSPASLTEVAYNCGYYDQSHFIHDFKEFSGEHPRTYFSGKAEGTGYRDV